ncbi:MAG: GH3 family domain-containing protein [Nitrososphaeria archaeon]
MNAVLKPWYESLSDPETSQENTLRMLLEDYRRTEYGRSNDAMSISSMDEFRRNFKCVRYDELVPIIGKVFEGNYHVLLSEPPVAWVMTRGSTGPAKLIPVTQKHLSQVRSCGARAILNYVLKKKGFEILQAKVLNLNFPSRVGRIQDGKAEATYGHSSGTYARFNPSFAGLNLVPRQEEIDAVGGGLAEGDWERRFERIYELTREEDIKICIGVAPVITGFARYLRRTHSVLPKNFWNVKAIFCTSVPKIHWKYAPVLKYFYGEVDVVEMYTATEGVFAQQLNSLPYVSPNYDVYLFEVITRGQVKMLYEMKRGEWGRLIISSTLFPRYEINDMIECLGRNYFRVFGRANNMTVLEHLVYRTLVRWFV